MTSVPVYSTTPRTQRLPTAPANYPETVQRDDLHFHQSEEMAWRYLGTAERMAAWARQTPRR